MIFSNLKENKFSLLIVFMTSLFIFQTYAQTITGSFESKFKRYKKNESFPVGITPTQEWSTVAWKGERINKQIVLWSNTSISGITYEYSVLNSVNGNGSIPSSNIELSFGKYVKGDRVAKTCVGYSAAGSTNRDRHMIELIDALSDTETTSLTSSDPIKLWITINVPTATATGIYRGTLTVRGGATPLVFSIELNVVNHTLPDVSDWSFHLDLWQFPSNVLERYNDERSRADIIAWSDKHFALLKPAYKLLADTGQKVITAYIKKNALGTTATTISPMVKWIKKADNTWDYDFTVFEKYVDSLMSWGITKQISCFSPLGWEENDIPYWDEATTRMKILNAPLESEIYATRWHDFLTEFKMVLDRKGWFDKTVLYLDEPRLTDELKRISLLVFENDSEWKLGIAYSHANKIKKSVKANDEEHEKINFYDLSGILEDVVVKDSVPNNKISTFYTSCSQTKPNNYVTPDNSLAEMTWMAWHSLKEGYDGYLRWAYDYWRLVDTFDARDGSNTAGDFFMIYRELATTDEEEYPFYKFLPSLRLMMLREGIQDFEKIKILRKVFVGDDSGTITHLNDIIKKFTIASGGQYVETYVEGGQTELAKISKTPIPLTITDIENIKSENRDVVYPSLLTKEKSLILYLPEAKGLRTKFFLFNIIGQIVYKKEYNVFSGKETIDIQDLLVNLISILMCKFKDAKIRKSKGIPRINSKKQSQIRTPEIFKEKPDDFKNKILNLRIVVANNNLVKPNTK